MNKINYVVLSLLIISNILFSQEITRLKHAHSHNDYNRSTPLFDALDCGFTSVEADIYLINGDLYVAHEENEISKKRTLKSLYLQPLQKIAQSTSNKYINLFPIILLVDIKSDGLATYKELNNQLAEYEGLVSKYVDNIKEQKLVDVIISGNRPKDFMASQKIRYAAIDGRLEDIEKASILYPLISCSVESLVSAKTNTDSVKMILADFASRVKGNDKISRLWGVPDRTDYWNIQVNAGLELVGTDNPKELKQFFMETEDK